MLQLNQLSLRRGERVLFRNASFQVYPGQRLGVTGANGSGKSSLFESIMGSLEADDGEIQLQQGSLIAHVSQQSPSSEQPAIEYVLDGDAELRAIQAILRDHPEDDSVEAHDAWAQLEAIDGYSAESRAARLLHGLGFGQEVMQQSVRDFSGGWRMRLNLAQALMCRSDLLLLDEPTNHLDLPAIIWLEAWLNRYQGILLLISHDRDFLDGVCTRIANIEHESMKSYSGNYSQFELLRGEQLAQQQALYSKQQKEVQHIQSYVDRFRYKASKAKQAQSRLKMLDRMAFIAPAHVDSPFHFTIPKPEKQPQHLLQLDEVNAGYHENEPVLSNVNVHLGAGGRLGLLGVNGAGKSTLVKALANGSTVQTGERIIHRDTRIGYFAQHQLDLLHPEQSPFDHIQLQHPNDREQELRNYLGSFGFSSDRIFDPVAPFSGGEKARLVLAMIIRQRPNLLLLDEPTNHLDLEMRHALSMALVEYEGALVVISHDRHLLRSVCDELLIVHDGLVDQFDLSMDDYPAWLAKQEELKQATAADGTVAEAKAPGRKQQRKIEAQHRTRLKPLSDRVRKLDREMSSLRLDLGKIENSLSDESLYLESERKPELTEMLKTQAELKTQLDSLEWEWLEASEALEKARSSIA
jgi:ATP-binding cassette subfamily F protein 3